MTAALPRPSGGHIRRPTATARFGSSRRESHDPSGFYDRFVTPDLSEETAVARPKEVDAIYRQDARDMGAVETNSVALVVTSPPYFAGKEYEESLGENGVPATYFEYLTLLRDVLDECKRVLEPGGRVAVNVANLGRRPYRSLAGDVTEMMQDLGLLLRGEVVWWKGRAAGGSCAWGTFQRPSNPVLRDVTERIVIASKGRFDRALKPAERHRLHLPSTATISRDEFLEATTDLWEIPPESATRVGHPAPFPVSLPKRLIELYTYDADVVLDPFMGSGSTAVAAIRTGRHYIGFETDQSYLDRSKQRIGDEVGRLQRPTAGATTPPFRVQLPAVSPPEDGADPQARAVREGRQAKDVAFLLLAGCQFEDIRSDVKIPGLGIALGFIARDQDGAEWGFDLSGGFTACRSGLRRTDTLWKALGKAAVLHQGRRDIPLVLLTTEPPVRGSAGSVALDVVKGPGRPVLDVIELLNPRDQERLAGYAREGRPER
ncbi:MAG TPA: site-specific DNA-methyltransferase [Acidimicrobiales bacterium]|nr:site-specific DNA-methyltransferase [Acidimicrobiales bacterium]